MKKFKDSEKVKYYAISTESSDMVKIGEVQPINKEEVEEVLETRKAKFWYPINMHWDFDRLSCKVVKETIITKCETL